MSPHLFLEAVCIGSLIESAQPLIPLIGWLGLGHLTDSSALILQSFVLSVNANNTNTARPSILVAYAKS